MSITKVMSGWVCLADLNKWMKKVTILLAYIERTTFRANTTTPSTPTPTPPHHPHTHLLPQNTRSAKPKSASPSNAIKHYSFWWHTAAIQKPTTNNNAISLNIKCRIKINSWWKNVLYLEYSCLKLQTSALKSWTVWRIATLASLLDIWKRNKSAP